MHDIRTASVIWPRLKFVAQVILFAELVCVLLILIGKSYYPDAFTQIIVGNDFRVFLAAGQIAAYGKPAQAYNLTEIVAAMQAVDPTITSAKPWFGWFYPPTFLLFVQCLVLLPPLLAFAAFIGGTLYVYLLTVRRAAGQLPVFWATLAFPPIVITAFNGQNSFLTAALAGSGLMLLDRRPAVAGFCIGLLAIKPQLAMLFPVALACSGRWKAFVSAALTVLAVTGLSYLMFGGDAFTGFLNGLDNAREAVLHPEWPLMKMPTAFAAALAAGSSISYANALQAAVSVTATGVVIWSWNKQLPAPIRNSFLVLATLTVTPHLFNYDLTWLGLAIAWMAREGVEDGWLKGERIALICAWLSPLILEDFAKLIGSNLGFLVPIALMGFLVRRVRLFSTQALQRCNHAEPCKADSSDREHPTTT